YACPEACPHTPPRFRRTRDRLSPYARGQARVLGRTNRNPAPVSSSSPGRSASQTERRGSESRKRVDLWSSERRRSVALRSEPPSQVAGTVRTISCKSSDSFEV